MNSIDQLKERLRGKTAEEAVDALYHRGAIDQQRARQFVIIEAFEERYTRSADSARKVQEDLAFEYGTTRQTVRRYLGT